MLKQIFDEQVLPMEDLERIGLAKDGRAILDEDDIVALLSGRRTGMLRLENLFDDGFHIPALDAKLSLKPGVGGKPDLLIHPIHRNPEPPAYLTDTEAGDLENGNAVNIEKQIDGQGLKRNVLVEFDNETWEFIITDSDKILVPDMVNNECLSPGQKDRYRKGKEVELSDGTIFQYSGTDSHSIRSNKLALIASVLIDGGVSYVLYKGLNALFGQTRDKGFANEYGKGYYTDLERIQSDERSQELQLNRIDDNGQYSRGYSRGSSR